MRKLRWGLVAGLLCVVGAPGWAASPGQLVASPAGAARAQLFARDGGAMVVVERRAPDGAWRQAWQAALRNGEAGNVFLADNGRLVAFDDGSRDGAHAIELFDARGQRVRELALGDFLPVDYVRALRGFSGGLRWRGAALLMPGQDSVEFSVAVPGASAPALRFSVDLRDGVVRTSQIREYLAAAEQAHALAVRPLIAAR